MLRGSPAVARRWPSRRSGRANRATRRHAQALCGRDAQALRDIGDHDLRHREPGVVVVTTDLSVVRSFGASWLNKLR